MSPNKMSCHTKVTARLSVKCADNCGFACSDNYFEELMFSVSVCIYFRIMSYLGGRVAEVTDIWRRNLIEYTSAVGQ
jgi:hypothetical protein